MPTSTTVRAVTRAVPSSARTSARGGVVRRTSSAAPGSSSGWTTVASKAAPPAIVRAGHRGHGVVRPRPVTGQRPGDRQFGDRGRVVVGVRLDVGERHRERGVVHPRSDLLPRRAGRAGVVDGSSPRIALVPGCGEGGGRLVRRRRAGRPPPADAGGDGRDQHERRDEPATASAPREVASEVEGRHLASRRRSLSSRCRAARRASRACRPPPLWGGTSRRWRSTSASSAATRATVRRGRSGAFPTSAEPSDRPLTSSTAPRSAGPGPRAAVGSRPRAPAPG
jgi:hypothetical protein